MVEGLYSGLGSGAALSSMQLDVKMKLLVEAPAAVEDALASLLDHHDATLQVGHTRSHLPSWLLAWIYQQHSKLKAISVLIASRRGLGDSVATR